MGGQYQLLMFALLIIRRDSSEGAMRRSSLKIIELFLFFFWGGVPNFYVVIVRTADVSVSSKVYKYVTASF